MQCTKDVVVQVSGGLRHQAAARFTSVVRVVYGDNNVNAKSLLGVLSLAIGNGAQVTLTADGPDAEEALADLERDLSEA